MVVRMRATRAHTANRRSHHALKNPPLATCANCGASVIRHRACASCGTYRGKSVLNVAAKAQKRAEKKQARETKEAAPAGKDK